MTGMEPTTSATTPAKPSRSGSNTRFRPAPIGTRLTTEELEQVRTYAETQGLSVSALIRKLILKAASS